MTLSAFNFVNNLHDGTLKRLDHFPDNRIVVMVVDFLIWFQGWFTEGMPENGHMLVVFEGVRRVSVPEGFSFSTNTVYRNEYKDGALCLFCGWVSEHGEDYGEVEIEAESVSVQILPETPAGRKVKEEIVPGQFNCQAQRTNDLKTGDYLAEERFNLGDRVVVQVDEDFHEEIAEIISSAPATVTFVCKHPKKVLRAWSEGEKLWKPLRGNPLRGYLCYEEDDSTDPAFETFFALIREKAKSLNCVFFIQAGDGHDFSGDGLEGEDLWGWLIPISLADRFENLWAHGESTSNWDEDYFCCAEWQKIDDTIEIRFVNYKDNGEKKEMWPEASFRNFYRVIFPYGSQEYTYLGGDTDYEIGDRVVVPAGRDNHEAVVEIVSKEKKSAIDAPFPIEKLKTILRKVDSDVPKKEEIASFHIEADNLHWLTDNEEEDYCLHGKVTAMIGGYEISYESVTVSATALMLLRTLTEDHKLSGDLVQMLPCCGRPLPPMNDNPERCVLITCPNGEDWTVHHDGGDVILDIGAEDGTVFRVPINQYRTEVFRFADEIEAFYLASKPKMLSDDPDEEEGYEAFWHEWHIRRGAIR